MHHYGVLNKEIQDLKIELKSSTSVMERVAIHNQIMALENRRLVLISRRSTDFLGVGLERTRRSRCERQQALALYMTAYGYAVLRHEYAPYTEHQYRWRKHIFFLDKTVPSGMKAVGIYTAY